MKMTRRLALFGTALLLSLTAAAEYSYMEFRTADGVSHIISAEGLVITLSGQNLVATNSLNENLELPATAVVSMQFTDYINSLPELETTLGGSVTVYSLAGKRLGHFASAKQAWSKLAKGAYILKDNNGKSAKIVVRR